MRFSHDFSVYQGSYNWSKPSAKQWVVRIYWGPFTPAHIKSKSQFVLGDVEDTREPEGELLDLVYEIENYWNSVWISSDKASNLAWCKAVREYLEKDDGRTEYLRELVDLRQQAEKLTKKVQSKVETILTWSD